MARSASSDATCTHQRAFVVVPVSPGAEHDDQLAAAQISGRAQNLGQTIRGVGVVHYDREWLAGVDQLEATPHSGHRGQALGDHRRVDARGHGRKRPRPQHFRR